MQQLNSALVPCLDGLGRPFTEEAGRAYDALQIAAQRIARNGWLVGRAAHIKAGRRASTYRYTPTDALNEVVRAMPAVLSGKITPEEAMALINSYDVQKERLMFKQGI